MYYARLNLVLTCLLAFVFQFTPTDTRAVEVVAFWGFANDYDFAGNPKKQDFVAEAGTQMGVANLQAFLGREDGNNDELDNNGGGGFLAYTSPASGITYQPTRTVKWDDLRGGGDDFDIAGQSEFMINKKDGQGVITDNFSNDALMYITFDGSGYRDFDLRFDIEATPGELPTTYDVFYRVGGSGTWFREFDQDDIGLNFMDYATPDPENQFASSEPLRLAPVLNNQSQIEIIVNDFAESGNDEMEIDNIEIIGAAIPEPSGLTLMASLAACGAIYWRR